MKKNGEPRTQNTHHLPRPRRSERPRQLLHHQQRKAERIRYGQPLHQILPRPGPHPGGLRAEDPRALPLEEVRPQREGEPAARDVPTLKIILSTHLSRYVGRILFLFLISLVFTPTVNLLNTVRMLVKDMRRLIDLYRVWFSR